MDHQLYNDELPNAIKPAILIHHAPNEHISVAEHHNITVQERMKSILAWLPIKQYQR